MTAGRVVGLWLAILACALVAVLAPGHTLVAGTPTLAHAACDAAAARVFAAQDYTGSADERACLGEESDWRVGLALDYGLTPTGYAAAEQAEG